LLKECDVFLTGRKILAGLLAAGVGIVAGELLPHDTHGQAPGPVPGDSIPPDSLIAARADEGRAHSLSTDGPDNPRPLGTRPHAIDAGGPRLGPSKFGPRARMVPPERVEEGMAFLKEHWPERYETLDRLRKDDPEAFGMAFRNAWPQLVRIIELSRRNPEMAEIEMALVKVEFEVHGALHRHRRAVEKGETQQALAIQEELKELLAQRFDLDIRRTELRIQELEERLVQQRQQLEARRQEKQAHVDRVVQDLLSHQPALLHGRGKRLGGLGNHTPGEVPRSDPALDPTRKEAGERHSSRKGKDAASKPSP